MASNILKLAVIGITVILLSGCASVDQFGARIYDSNVNSQTALDQETLLNIIRASRYQNPNFVAITQVTGGQTEAVTTGFPTFTVGPHAAPTLITNSLATGVSGGYQTNPLVSSQFEEGILSPVTTRAVAQLLKSQSREPVFYTVIDSIVFKVAGRLITFVNDPTDDSDPSGSEITCKEKVAKWGASELLKDDRVCRFSKFENFLNKYLEFGFSAELNPRTPDAVKKGGSGNGAIQSTSDKAPSDPKKSGAANSGNADKSTPMTASLGTYCFDPALATRFYEVPSLKEQQCGQKYAKKPDLVIKNFGGIGRVEILEVSTRSLAQIYAFLGKIQRYNVANRISYFSISGKKLLRDGEKFLNIDNSISLDCEVSILYDRVPYCVPSGSDNTQVIFSILQQIRNLSIQPSDLNSAFTVRLSGT